MRIKYKRRVCGWIGVLALIWALGLVGGLECEMISVGSFFWRAAVLAGISVAALYKGGWLR